MIEPITQLVSVFVGFYLSLMATTHTPVQNCGEFKGLQYCSYQGAPESKRTVYFLHGFGNDVEAWSWNSVTDRIEKEWKDKQLPRPHIVSISYGKIWWYHQKRGLELTEFLHHIENKNLISHHDRVLYGDSMGGHNSFRWAADYPGLFRKIALICPALPLSFALNLKEESSGLWPVNHLADLVLSDIYQSSTPPLLDPLRNKNFWEQLKGLSRVHIIVSKTDHFGFYSGGVDLYHEFKKFPEIKVSFEEQTIRHCDASAEQLAPFLAI